MRFAHLTTVHPRTDTRIRIREAESLAKAFAEPVALFVMDGKGDAIEAGSTVQVADVGQPLSRRFTRMIVGNWRMWRKVRVAHPQIVHFHDPELIPLGLILKICGYRVVYDVHEDLPRQILTKYWLPTVARWPISWAMSILERLVTLVFDAIIPATPKIAGRFPPQKSTPIQNFPILNELVNEKVISYQKRPTHFAYIGGLTRERGVCEMINALMHTENITLYLAGTFQPNNLQAEVETLPGWKQVAFAGWAERNQVAEILGNAKAGLVVLHPTPRSLDAYPTKMFEYMSVGLPVIVSDFPLWRGIVEDAGCGLVVDPLNPQAIADAMRWILDHPAEAEAMGRCGREAVEKHYNWETEAEKLVAIYKKLLST